jgi:DNA topoisomerase-2
MSTESKKYQKLTELQHVLKNPGMYIGTMDYQKREYHILSANEKRILKSKQLKIIPGFIQIFQEILSNAIDHEQEDPGMTMIKVNIDQEKGEISVMNNGKGIPVVMHEKEKMYIPEMVFGEFKSGSNFGDKPRKAGGKHGIGAKATNAFSKSFTVETVANGTKFVQTFSNNMSEKTKPKITKSSTKDYTKITYTPDFEKFGMKDNCIDKAHFDIMKWRVFGAAAITSKKISVYFNDVKIPIKDFSDYIKLYAQDQPIISYACNDDWEIGMMLKENDDGFEQVSFVNGIPTIDGGQHVDYIASQITKRVGDLVKKRLRSKSIIRANYILNNIKLFVKAKIFDPDFPSQNKYTLSTEPQKFGTSCEVPDKIVDKFADLGLIDRMTELLKFKEDTELKKQSGKKSAKIKGISKLDDANDAGGKNSSDCILVVTEGDSAKALAMSGRGSVKNGNNKIGVFPLRGKLKNVREIKKTEAIKNEEIINIVKIMGLKYGEKYTDTKSLRYGKIMIFTDADVDGTHIKGLIMNFIDHFWPDLLKIKGFVTSLATPIIKAFKRGKNPETIDFYSLSEYQAWLEKNDGSNWQIKYYKGLGTSTKEEAKEYFQDYINKLINYQNCSEKDKLAMQLAFDKDKADARKKWVSEYDPSYVIDQSNKNVCLEQFVNKELIHFSTYDNARSIPSVVDGFKPSQRKIVHTCFLLNLIHPKEMKVARLAGAVGEKTGYHHGETSLQGAIVKLAQTFVGANNINVLFPGGQFGSREEGGKDASAARYIYTALTEETQSIFNKFDLPLLEYVDEDGLKAEPYWFVPIIPMILVNGANGIGTGYSTSVLNYNPKDIINNLINKLHGKDYIEMTPWFKGFTGTIIKVNKTEYYCKGKYEIVNDKTLKITELPVGVWYGNYKTFLEKLENTKVIKGFRRHDSDDHTDFIIDFHDTKTLRALDKKNKKKHINALEEQFKLVSSLKTTNMHLFDPKGIIKRYSNVEEIMDEFYELRLEYYLKRREYLLKKIEREMLILKMKVQFINDVIGLKIKINNIKWTEVEKQLHQADYIKFSKFDLQKDSIELNIEDPESNQLKEEEKNYEYLKRMPIYSLTKEEKERLEALLKNKKEQFDILNETTDKKMWFADLQSLSFTE